MKGFYHSVVTIVLLAAIFPLVVVGADDPHAQSGDDLVAPLIAQIEKCVNLTSSQKAEMRAVGRRYVEAVRRFEVENAGKLRSTSDQLDAAIASGDRSAISSASRAFDDARKPITRMGDRLYPDVTRVLTDSQRRNLEENEFNIEVNELTDPVRLKPEQIAELKRRYHSKLGDDEGMSAAVLKMLSSQQKAAIVRQRAIDFSKEQLRSITLTKAQHSNIEDITLKFSKSVNFDRSWPGFDPVMTETLRPQLIEVLTAEQRELLPKVFSGTISEVPKHAFEMGKEKVRGIPGGIPGTHH